MTELVALAVAVVLMHGAHTADLWKPHVRPETPCAPFL